MAEHVTTAAAAAARWARTFGEHSAAAELVALARVQPGHAVLDIASASAETAVTAARIAGPEGRVMVVDVIRFADDTFGHRITQSGVGNVEVAIDDLSSLDLPPHAFDVAVSSFGLVGVADPVRLLRRTRELLVPRGRLAVAVWSAPDRVPLANLALAAADVDPPEDVFGLSAREALANPLNDAGFTDVVTTTATVIAEFTGPEAYAEFAVEAVPPVRDLAAAGKASREAVTAAVADRARSYAEASEDGALHLRNEALLAVAVA